MLSQLEFKLSVEKQYKDGIEKMVRLYQMEGDRKSKADAEARRIESNQKIQLLKQSLKRYEDLHVDVEGADGGDGKLCFYIRHRSRIDSIRRRQSQRAQPKETVERSLISPYSCSRRCGPRRDGSL